MLLLHGPSGPAHSSMTPQQDWRDSMSPEGQWERVLPGEEQTSSPWRVQGLYLSG